MSRFGIEKCLKISFKGKKELRLDIEEFKLELLMSQIITSLTWNVNLERSILKFSNMRRNHGL